MAQILVIEDDDVFRLVISRMLEKFGHQVSTARNGNEGLVTMAHRPAELVITDLVMPEKEGIETIRELRRLYPGLRIIAMSGGANHEMVRQNLQCAAILGAGRILTKPFGPDELLAALDLTLKVPPSHP